MYLFHLTKQMSLDHVTFAFHPSLPMHFVMVNSFLMDSHGGVENHRFNQSSFTMMAGSEVQRADCCFGFLYQ
ncbi:hypothetical protein PISMIDRAFT_463457 [Pisolithus microcarpus 441]|uniref:Uncharacterized protein n=1 Tax=Pisolithus microcarpus 441 TaxID=765257 RepID=A0A0C9ZBN0_9AGAM|nr:hypothetical protein PISMIDRAFT_463457 [Pisolithus microcarpus 441]